MGVWVVREGRNGGGKGGIRRGEEVTVSYGKGFWDARRGGEDGGGMEAPAEGDGEPRESMLQETKGEGGMDAPAEGEAEKWRC